MILAGLRDNVIWLRDPANDFNPMQALAYGQAIELETRHA